VRQRRGPQDSDAAFPAVHQVQGHCLLQQGVSGAPPPNTHMLRSATEPVPACTDQLICDCPYHQTESWKAGHKRECAQGQGSAAAALIQVRVRGHTPCASEGAEKGAEEPVDTVEWAGIIHASVRDNRPRQL